MLLEDSSLWTINHIEPSPFVDYWMKYDKDTYVLEGSPLVEDLGYLSVTIIASDMTDSV